MNNQESYEYLANIDSMTFTDKSVLIIGAGEMASQYALALSRMNIKDVTIISRTKGKVTDLCKKYNFNPLEDGYEKNLPSIKRMDLVIITTPIHLLLPVAELAIKSGQTNILIEKPGSLYSTDLLSMSKEWGSNKIRIAYNRLVYPNFHKLKHLVEEDGGISSCTYSFNEWIHKINFEKDNQDTYQRLGISNSLHVISMVLELIGMPKEISAYQSEPLDWHPSGSVFVGSGITEKSIPFSYHANWQSSGRWTIEVMTRKNAYRLIPLEELHVCHKYSVQWEKVSFKSAYPDVKAGIAEEIAVMLDKNSKTKTDLVTLERAGQYNKVAEKIFGYDSTKQPYHRI